MTIPGLMQDGPLLIQGILRYAAAAHPDREIVSRLTDEPNFRGDYARLAGRAAQAAHAMRALGVRSGDRVTSLAWNTHRHLELFYAVPGIGAVLHTANPRFPEEQLIHTINQAESRVLLFDRSFAALVERLRSRLAHVVHYVMLGLADAALCYEPLLAEQDDRIDWPSFDEKSGAFLCYTSGTSGNPKGVLLSHRSVVLHAMAAGLSGALGFSAFDCIMPCQSLYHATAWGLPFAAAINGCKLVLPCDKFDGASLHRLISEEGVTFSGGVPTIWTLYLDHLERTGASSGTLQKLVIGGSAVPRAMAEQFERKYGVKVRQLWGMTETSPLGVVATPTPRIADLGGEHVDEIIWTRQGRMQFGIELRIVDDHGHELAHDGASAGALHVRGPWVVRRYYGAATDATDAEGWFETGDIATIDPHGFMRITDRSKDVIKSGGEWISSIDLENTASACPGVRIAAVVGVFHPKWEERPVLVIEPHDGETVTREQVLAFLAPRIEKWWTPDAVEIAPVPLTATGKIDKKTLRAIYRERFGTPPAS